MNSVVIAAIFEQERPAGKRLCAGLFIGSLVIGFSATVSGPDGRWLMPSLGRQFRDAGFCGGYTRCLRALILAQDREWPQATGNIAMSVAL